MTMRTLSDDFGTTYRLSPTDVYFEQTVAFRASPSIVKRSGLLSKKWKTGRLICMEQGIEGAYIAHNIGPFGNGKTRNIDVGGSIMGKTEIAI